MPEGSHGTLPALPQVGSARDLLEDGRRAYLVSGRSMPVISAFPPPTFGALIPFLGI